jgi:hypothetical protein
MKMTLAKLIDHYRTDEYSSYQRLKYPVRVKHDRLLIRISREHGDTKLRDIRARTLQIWYHEWQADGKVAMAISLVKCLRQLFRFGAGMLEERNCLRLHDLVSGMRLESIERRSFDMSKDQAVAIRAKAHEFGWHSIALAQAFQYELLLRQKDVIGEWVPLSEPGESDVSFRGQKWLRGLRWSHISDTLLLKFETGKAQRPMDADLRTAPMVIEEFAFLGGRGSQGPVVICEITGAPYTTSEFRRKWRILADAAGIPRELRNSDSKPAGLIASGPNRATISRHYTLKDLYRGYRRLSE